MNYEDLKPLSRREAEREISTGERGRISTALTRLALHDPDPAWLEDLLVRWLDGAKDSWVRGVAVMCLGHVARLHGQLDRDRVLPRLVALSQDPEIGGRVADAIDDIEQFVKPDSRDD